MVDTAAHNGNLSNGIMFPVDRQYTGRKIDKKYVEARAKWEVLYEVTQIKGDGETHPVLSPDDEFADYYRRDKGSLDLQRKETCATTDSRICVRFFGGWDFTDADVQNCQPAADGYTVDLANASWSNTIGASELAAAWTDPDSDAQRFGNNRSGASLNFADLVPTPGRPALAPFFLANIDDSTRSGRSAGHRDADYWPIRASDPSQETLSVLPRQRQQCC